MVAHVSSIGAGDGFTISAVPSVLRKPAGSGCCAGVALACLFPLLSAFTHAAASREIAIWLVLMTFLSLLTLALRWYGQGFEYRGQLAVATHELRMRLGEQLRSMPLTTLQSARAGISTRCCWAAWMRT